MPYDLIDQQLKKGPKKDPAQTILDCVRAMDHLKTPHDQKLSMCLEHLQRKISVAVMQLSFKQPRKRKNVIAVNQNAPTRH